MKEFSIVVRTPQTTPTESCSPKKTMYCISACQIMINKLPSHLAKCYLKYLSRKELSSPVLVFLDGCYEEVQDSKDAAINKPEIKGWGLYGAAILLRFITSAHYFY